MCREFSFDDVAAVLIGGSQKGITVADHDGLKQLQLDALLRSKGWNFRIGLFRASKEIFNDDAPRGCQGRLLVRHTKALRIEI